MPADVPADGPPRRREAAIALAGAALIRLLAVTWRVRVSYDQELRKLRAARSPLIFSLWHGQMLPLLYHHRAEGVAILISEHADGEIIARVAARLGHRSVRGSTSRGATRALLALSRVIGEGNDLAITPDGPRGPAKSVAPGVLVVAQRAGAPILPVAVAVSSAWRLRSWDGFLIPKPFARVHVAYGDLIRVDAANARQAASQVDLVTAGMAQAEQRAGG